MEQTPLTSDEIATVGSASPNLIEAMGGAAALTSAQIAALRALINYIRTHPGT